MNILFVPKVEERVLEEVVLDEPLSPKFMIDQVGDRIYYHIVLLISVISFFFSKKRKKTFKKIIQFKR